MRKQEIQKILQGLLILVPNYSMGRNTEISDMIDCLRIGIKYLVFDTEALRRELKVAKKGK